MYTYQDYEAAVEKGRLLTFVRDAIEDHRKSDAYGMAVTADAYDAQKNTTINSVVRQIYSVNGTPTEDFTASNHRIASNLYRRLTVERCTYSLGNGVEFDVDGVKDKLGPEFDTRLYKIAYNAQKHGVCYGFWNLDELHVFPFTEFVPLVDEWTGALRAGIRYWCLDWGKKPVTAVLYTEQGYAKYQSKDGKAGLALEEVEPMRAYVRTVTHTDAGGDEIIGEDNYDGALPIVPLYANDRHESTLAGIRASIDSMDIIASGYANELADVAQLFFMIGGGGGMTQEDLQEFMDTVRLLHVAKVDTDNSSVTPYQQEPPYNAREAYLARIEKSIYRDFGAFDPQTVAAGAVTATQINAAYQTMDEEADDLEYQVIKFTQQILRLQGIEATPQFKRNRISNQAEQVQMVMQEANYLDDESVLDLLPNINPDMKEQILLRRYEEGAARLGGGNGEMDEIKQQLAAIRQLLEGKPADVGQAAAGAGETS